MQNLPQDILQAYLKIADYLTEKDDLERALQLLRLLPSYQRQWIPIEIIEKRKELTKSVWTLDKYSKNNADYPKDDQFCMTFMEHVTRAKVLAEKIKELNDQDVYPTIIDYGPGDFCLPIGMTLKNLKFNYSPIGVECEAWKQAKARIKQSFSPKVVTIFVAYEVIEHLPSENDIAYNAFQYDPDFIFLSTPRFYFGEGRPGWKTEGQPHLRTYTPDEFIQTAVRLFPDKKLKFVDDPVMVITLE